MIGFWFAFEDIAIPEVAKVNLGIDPAYEYRGNAYYPLGSNYFISLEFPERVFEPVPEELQ